MDQLLKNPPEKDLPRLFGSVPKCGLFWHMPCISRGGRKAVAHSGRQDSPLHLPLIGAGLAVVFWSALQIAHFPGRLLLQGMVVLVLIALLGRFNLTIPLARSPLTVSEPFIFGAMLVGGPFAGAFIAGMDGWINSSRHTRRTRTRLVSLSVMALSGLAGGFTLEILAPPGFRQGQNLGVNTALAVLTAAAVHFLVNSWSIALLTALRDQRNPMTLWGECFRWTWVSYMAAASLAMFAWKAVREWHSLALALVVPGLALIYMMYRTYIDSLKARKNHLEDRVRLYQQMMEAFALAIEARDPEGRGHAKRVQAYAEAIGQLVRREARIFAPQENIDEGWFESLRAAALLHDVGKIGLPDHLLAASGPCLPAEREQAQQHPVLGAAILGRLSFPSALGPMIRHHHERWDGQGYPDGLKGEAIPLAARIIGMADALDLMPLRAVPHTAAATDEMRHYLACLAGNQLDPRLADQCSVHLEEILQHVSDKEITEEVQGLLADPEKVNALASIAQIQRGTAGLFGLARQIGESLDIEETLNLVVKSLVDLLPPCSISLYLADPRTHRLMPRATCGPLSGILSRQGFESGEGNTGWVYAHGTPLMNADPRVDLGRDAGTPEQRCLDAWLFPVSDREGPVGVLAIYFNQPEPCTPNHRSVIEGACLQSAQALRNALLYEATRTTSMTDLLTGLPNYRFLQTHLEKELSRATRKGLPLVVVLMDLDGFKQINDLHGHQSGDEVLRQVASVLRDSFRQGDIVCRYAGDEFVALLPETSPEEARPIVRRVQDAVGDTFISLPDGGVASVGVSIGFSCFPLDGGSLEDLVHRADKEMYRDKAQRHVTR